MSRPHSGVDSAIPAETRLQARSFAHRSWAFTKDRTARTAPARAAADARFEQMVDPNNELEPEERARRAASARKAFYLELSAKALAARRRKAAAADQAPTPTLGHRSGCQLPPDHASECRRASNPNFGGRP